MISKPFEIDTPNFEIINALDDRALQKIFREVSTTNIAMALKDANDETKEKVFRNAIVYLRTHITILFGVSHDSSFSALQDQP